MKKLYLDSLYEYPKKEVYILANKLGRRLVDFLGKEIFCLLLDSKILLATFKIKRLPCFSDDTYKLHAAAKALEGYLRKVIEGKKLQEFKDDTIGNVFGKKDKEVRKKIKDKKLIAKTKAVWDFCRNDIMHYSSSQSHQPLEMYDRYKEIVEIIPLLFKDFYGRTEPDEEIKKNYKKYVRFKRLK